MQTRVKLTSLHSQYRNVSQLALAYIRLRKGDSLIPNTMHKI